MITPAEALRRIKRHSTTRYTGDDADFEIVERALNIFISNRVNEYAKGTWFQCRSIDEMQQFYESRLPMIRSAARDQGYAIGLHGSMRRDLDLIAMPWKDNPCTKDSLAQAIQSAACGIAYEKITPEMWTKKPSGRYAISLPICWTDHSEPFKDMLSAGHIDLSVMSAGVVDI